MLRITIFFSNLVEKEGKSLLGFLLSKIVLGKTYELIFIFNKNNLKGAVIGLTVFYKESIPNVLKDFPDV